jgi:hypothetical protein
MNYNAIVSITDVTDDSGAYEEPVSIQEFKDYMRLEGYIDTDESTADELSDFDFDDSLIAKVLKRSRIKVEKKYNVSLMPKTLEVVITNLCGMQELPYPPIGDVISLYQEDGTTEILAANYTVIGNSNKYLKEPLQKNMVITYDTGVADDDYNQEILRLAAYLYENRGDDSKSNEVNWTIA